MSDISNKQRILKIKEIFEKETDEEHELSFDDIIERLRLKYGPGYEVGVRAIKDDVKTLMDVDPSIAENRDKFGKKLFCKVDRKFEVYELRMLIDAISSARFTTPTDTTKLIDKIKSLTSNSLSRKLINQIYVDNRIVCENNELKYNIDKLHNAVQHRKVIRFKYERYNVYKEIVEGNDGNYYEVEPYGVVWNNGFYYLVGFNLSRKEIINYRIDRMRRVEEQDESFTREYFNLAEHINKCFNMYPGTVSHIEIKFDKHLINAIIDRFGKDVNIKVAEDGNFILKTDAAINEGLVRWILNWGSDAKVLYPPMLIKEVKKEIEKMSDIYNQ